MPQYRGWVSCAVYYGLRLSIVWISGEEVGSEASGVDGAQSVPARLTRTVASVYVRNEIMKL